MNRFKSIILIRAQFMFQCPIFKGFFHASLKIKIKYFESLFFKKLLVTRESNVSSAISSHVYVNQMNDVLVPCIQVIAVVYVRKADTYPIRIIHLY